MRDALSRAEGMAVSFPAVFGDYHILRVSSQVTCPVRRLTSSLMCWVPPGLSPPLPFQRQMKRGALDAAGERC